LQSSERVADTAFVALGSNLGDRAAYLNAARIGLANTVGVSLLAASRVEETAPFGGVPQGPYLNQMVAVRTSLAPLELLGELLLIERRLGRQRGARWGARTIDLDIVRFGGLHVELPGLTIPHPGLRDRGFWQRELAELDRLVRAAA
jgi:2-amino-4-hydroxy-6-hydroxymethyldihydropteridine diphosphokinase